MSYCLNPDCQKPQNSVGTIFCLGCGSKLLLGERYRAIKLIGQGGFGRTFLSVDEYEAAKPRCVIKQFYLQSQGSYNAEKAAELFKQESRRLADLGKHPQIPELLAYLTQDNRQYLVQELIDGQNLAEALEAEGAFRETQIRDLLNRLLPVLKFIHDRNIIHRDINPKNIIRCRDGQLVLVDFGAAKLVTGTALLKTGTTIGSAEYVAPEQARGKAVFASDLYSLGVTCIHLLTSVSPFDLFDTAEATWVWRQYLVNNPVSEQLGDLLDKLIETATKKRYQSAAEVLLDLSQLNQETSTLTTPALIRSVSKSPIQTWRCIHTLQEHSNWVNSVAISPDGETLVSGSRDKTILIWQLDTGKKLCTLTGHTSFVYSVAISPDGQTLISGSEDTTIKLWQMSKGRQLRTLGGRFSGHSHWVNSVAISPDGETLISGSTDKTIKLWRLGTGRELHTLTGHSSSVRSVAITPDGQTIVTGSDDTTIKLWQMGTGKKLHTLTGHSNRVGFVAITPDAQTLVSGSDDRTIKLWDLKAPRLISTLIGHSTWPNCVAISPDGQTFVSGEHKTIKIWQLNTGREISSFTGHSDWVNCVAFSPDGKILASGSADNTIKIWRCD
jgi:WD40 repeat protein